MRSDRSPSVAYKALMKPDEDWRNLPNNAERRKLQNRIAQRAYRRNMRERTDEVELLKRKVRELEETAREGTAFEVFGNVSSSTSRNALGGQSQDTDLNSNRNNAGGQDSTEHRSTGWPQSSEREGLDVLRSPSRAKSPQDLDASACFSKFMHTDPLPSSSSSSQPQLPFNPPKRSPPLSDPRSEQNRPPKKRGQDILTPPFPPGHQPAGRAEDTDTSASLTHSTKFPVANATRQNNHAPPAAACMDVNNVSLWPGFDTRLPHEFSSSSSSSPPPLKLDLTEVGASPLHGQPTLLHLAIASGNADTLRLLLQNLEIPTNKRDAAGYTPLQRAVISGRTDLVTILLDHSVDLASDEEVSDPSIGADLGDTNFMSR